MRWKPAWNDEERHKWREPALSAARADTRGSDVTDVGRMRHRLVCPRPPRRITRAAPLQCVYAQTARIFTTRATWPPDVMPAKESAEAWERTVDLVVRRVTYSAAAGACAAVVLFRTPGTRQPFGCASSARVASRGR